MKKNLEVIVLLMAMVLTYGCSGSGGGETPEPEDTQKPEMTVSIPTEGATVSKGRELQLSGVFTDDMELESLTVAIRFNQNKAATGIDDPWEPVNSPEVITLSGKTDELKEYSLYGEAIPADCKGGSYVLTLDLKDKSGKMTSKQINISIGG
ncbi:DUF4625 domain-containing protein [Carboxylicivirga sp. RSCT41]|uniref:DUF4625 domain-containing protein n=1 Tax=Carboxylicivirga agarovorans TaxID=3417570 RepID=UPI003D34FFD3